MLFSATGPGKSVATRLLLAIFFRWRFLAVKFSSSRPPDLTTTSRKVDELNDHRETAALTASIIYMTNPKELACRGPCCSSAAWCRRFVLLSPTKNRASGRIFQAASCQRDTRLGHTLLSSTRAPNTHEAAQRREGVSHRRPDRRNQRVGGLGAAAVLVLLFPCLLCAVEKKNGTQTAFNSSSSRRGHHVMSLCGQTTC